MKDLRQLDRFRWRDWERQIHPAGSPDPSTIGCFRIERKIQVLRVRASAGMGWEHVSVSHTSRCPTWEEMEHVKRLFFHDHETAMQLHPAISDYKNCHPYCLHIWRPLDMLIPVPDSLMVAP